MEEKKNNEPSTRGRIRVVFFLLLYSGGFHRPNLLITACRDGGNKSVARLLSLFFGCLIISLLITRVGRRWYRPIVPGWWRRNKKTSAARWGEPLGWAGDVDVGRILTTVIVIPGSSSHNNNHDNQRCVPVSILFVFFSLASVSTSSNIRRSTNKNTAQNSFQMTSRWWKLANVLRQRPVPPMKLELESGPKWNLTFLVPNNSRYSSSTREEKKNRKLRHPAGRDVLRWRQKQLIASSITTTKKIDRMCWADSKGQTKPAMGQWRSNNDADNYNNRQRIREPLRFLLWWVGNVGNETTLRERRRRRKK